MLEYKDQQLKDYAINKNCFNNYRFIGYSVQQYITKVIKGERRGIRAFDIVKEQIPDYVSKYFNDLFLNGVGLNDLDLGYIPNIFSLTPLAQISNSPIYSLKYADGIVGNHYNMIESYTLEIDKIVNKIFENIIRVEKNDEN